MTNSRAMYWQLGIATLALFVLAAMFKNSDPAFQVMCILPVTAVGTFWWGFARGRRVKMSELVTGVQIIDRDCCTICYEKHKGFAEMIEHHLSVHRDIMKEGS